MMFEGRRPRIIVVDDDPRVRGAVADTLEDAGYAVLEASDGSQAVQLIANPGGVRMIVADVRTSRATEAASHVRKVHPGMLILVVAYKSDEQAFAFLDVSILRKPTEANVLIATVGRLLAEVR